MIQYQWNDISIERFDIDGTISMEWFNGIIGMTFNMDDDHSTGVVWDNPTANHSTDWLKTESMDWNHGLKRRRTKMKDQNDGPDWNETMDQDDGPK